MQFVSLRLLIVYAGLIYTLCMTTIPADTTGILTEICPPVGIQQRAAVYEPGGIILTTFDRTSIWVYNIDLNSRYPLPDTAPCSTNCHLSQDSRWITFFDADTRTFGKMRLDGTERTLLAENATEVEWWAEDVLLVWTPTHEAYLRQEQDTEREYLNVERIVSFQPGGYWGLRIEQDSDAFFRTLVNTEILGLAEVTGQLVVLGPDSRYFNAAAWSPDGSWLAYSAADVYDPNANIAGAEIFAIQPGDAEPVKWTDLNKTYGAVRINGHSPGDLSWSPDGTHIAFWVIELTGSSPESNTGHAVIHVLDIITGNINAYCGYATTEHTPNPPRLVWSPEGTHLVFGGNIPGDDQGYLLLALNTADGVFTQLSEGVYPALGNADAIAWGLPPR